MLLHLSLISSALTALALASPHPGPAQLAQRDFASCQQDGLVACCLYASPSLASPYCSSVLQTSTVTAPAVTLSTNVTSTVVVTVNATHIVPTTTTSTSVITTTGTLTITVVSTSATTTTTTTTTVNTALPTVAPPKARRDAAPSPPPCVTQGTSYPASRITFACSCLYTQPTITVTPSAFTAIITLLSTTSPVVTVTVYSTITVPLTITTTSSTTTSTTTTTATTAVSISTATVSYTLAVGPVTGEFVVYTIYYYYYIENGMDPGVNYENFVDSCRNSCTNDATCQFFFLSYSPTYLTNGPYCELSSDPYNSPYGPQYLDLVFPDSGAYYVGYNKVLS